MPTPTPTDDRQTISMPAEGAVLKAVRAYALEHELPLGRSALELISKGLADSAMLAELDPDEEATPAIVDLSKVPDEWITTEVARRLAQRPSLDDLTVERHRANRAEEKLEAVVQALAG